ncbi:uncharacterized protein G2W53_041045 [Senna tora]|uniref:Uncharacterized protein n=1 Tax=Senna tora TaxID=362788 RepID=A0A834W2J2_9FABA|nr:uncharacterized protein G2W53_041045 [Senna tora]
MAKKRENENRGMEGRRTRREAWKEEEEEEKSGCAADPFAMWCVGLDVWYIDLQWRVGLA